MHSRQNMIQCNQRPAAKSKYIKVKTTACYIINFLNSGITVPINRDRTGIQILSEGHGFLDMSRNDKEIENDVNIQTFTK
ncbi:MAG: hypothetical protein GTN76_02420 [Candidatus Aenigmarchaeota archaeon]|nr:hypothetical protein [Candidatus Aenigmarchaeota archaeon]